MPPQDRLAEDHHSEREPLITPPSHTSSEQDTSKNVSLWSRVRIPTILFTDPRYRFIPFLGCLIILFNEAEYFFKQAATMRAVESLFCIEYYNIHDPDLSSRLGRNIPERLCKDDAIQKQVAQAWAWVMGGRMLCAIIGAVPLGRLADTWGRKPVLILHKLSVICSALWQTIVYLAYPRLPIWSIYLSGLPGVFGGNFDVGLAVLFASYTDVMTDASQRTSLFFITTAMQYVGQAVCPAVGGLLMNLDGKGGTPLVALIVGIAMGFGALGVAMIFPETLKRKTTDTSPDDNHEEARPLHTVNSSKGDAEERGMRARFRSWMKKVPNGIEGLDAVGIVAIGTAMYLVAVGAKAIDWFGLLQYPVVRLGYSYSQASTVPSTQAVLTLILYAALLPSLTHILTRRYRLSPTGASLFTMSLSLTFLLLGALLLGLASTTVLFFAALAVYTLGMGFPTTMQGYLAGVINKDRLASVLAVLSLASIAGKASASLAWPVLLAVGLDKARRGEGEAWKGLPLFSAAVGFAVAGIGVGVVVLRHRRHGVEKTAGRAEAEVGRDEDDGQA